MTSFLIFLGIIAAIVFWAIGIYNRLVNERNRVRNAFAQIDVQLTRRHDLIPNLVEAVKGYMKHERETLENVIKARNVAVSALVLHVAFDGFHKVRDEVMTPGELDVNLRKCVSDTVAFVDQSVVNTNCPEHNCGDDAEKYQE